MIQAISALNLLLNLFLNSGAESMVQQAHRPCFLI
jgi:hypothetical protein